jgi:hypothetical protein
VQKSIARLRAILDLHASSRAGGKAAGMIYVCADEKGCARIRRRAAEAGLHPGAGRLRVEPLDTVEAAAVAASSSRRLAASVGRPGRAEWVRVTGWLILRDVRLTRAAWHKPTTASRAKATASGADARAGCRSGSPRRDCYGATADR